MLAHTGQLLRGLEGGHMQEATGPYKIIVAVQCYALHFCHPEVQVTFCFTEQQVRIILVSLSIPSFIPQTARLYTRCSKSFSA